MIYLDQPNSSQHVNCISGIEIRHENNRHEYLISIFKQGDKYFYSILASI